MTDSTNGVLPVAERITDEQIVEAAAPEAKKAKKGKKDQDQLENRVIKLEAENAELREYINALMEDVAKLTVSAREVSKVTRTGGGSIAPRNGAGIFGLSSTSILRWMGKQGWSNKECYAVCNSYGLSVSPATVQTQRQCGRKGIGALPELTEEQVKELTSRKAFVPVAQVTATPVVNEAETPDA